MSFHKLLILYILLFFYIAISSAQNLSADNRPLIDSTITTKDKCTAEYFRLFSPSMERDIKVMVVLPEAYKTKKQNTYPIVYTFHGARAPYDTWFKIIKRLKNHKKKFIYTCIDGDAFSAYIDAYYPIKTSRNRNDSTKQKSYFNTFFLKEFMPFIEANYRVDTAQRAMAGFSMGGLGAFNFMIQYPEKFKSVSVLSSVFFDFNNDSSLYSKRIEKYIGSKNEYPERYDRLDHYVNIKKLKDKDTALPPIYMHCGTEDRYLEENRKMYKYLSGLGYDVEYLESKGGHNWAFWEKAGGGVVDFLLKYFQ